jgi:hypothetical protein
MFGTLGSLGGMNPADPMQGITDALMSNNVAPISANSQQAGSEEDEMTIHGQIQNALTAMGEGKQGMPGGMVGKTLSGDSIAGGIASLFMGGKNPASFLGGL